MRIWPKWRSALLIVQPETVVRWLREGIRHYWRRKSQGRSPGRPAVEPEIRALIRRMSQENSTWGAPRIQSELALLRHALAESTVAKYLFRPTKPPSQTWRTFLDNHLNDLVGIDFLTVPTATCVSASARYLFFLGIVKACSPSTCLLILFRTATFLNPRPPVRPVRDLD